MVAMAHRQGGLLMSRVMLLLVALACLLPAGIVPAHGVKLDVAPDLLRETVATAPAASQPARGGSAPMPSGDDAGPSIRFKCPAQTDNQNGQAVVDSRLCPQYIIDLEDFLGQPRLVVDPYNPLIMAFSALHGGRGIHPPLVGREPPDPQSRHNLLHQPHTTFQSGSSGAQWKDNRYYAPEQLRSGDGRDIYGQDNDIVLDAAGRIYLGSVYAFAAPEWDEYHYAVALWKAARANRDVNYYENMVLLPKERETQSTRIDSLHMAYAPQTDRVVALWRAESRNDTNAPRGLASWIDAYYTIPGEGGRWDRLATTELIGPCRAITNALALGSNIYVGCLPGDGYAYSANATPDAYQIHVIDTTSWTTSYVAPTPISSSHALLVDQSGGYMIIVGSGATAGRKADVSVSWGILGSRWSEPESYGADFTNEEPPRGARLLDARVTAAAYSTEHSYLHLVYMERYEFDNQAQLGHANTLFKSYGLVRYRAGFAGSFVDELKFGDPAMRTAAADAYRGGLTDDVFVDLHDSIVIWHDPKAGKERIWIAFGDYGSVRFAEVVPVDFLAAIPLPPLNVPAIPLATPGTNPALNSAIAGVIFGLMLLRILASKRKNALAAAT
jgi:hypothetical protein